MQIPTLVRSALVLASGLSLLFSGIPVQAVSNAVRHQSSPVATRTQKETPQSQVASPQTIDQLIDTEAMMYLEVQNIRSQVETLRIMELLKGFGPFWEDLYLFGLKIEAIESLWSLVAPSIHGADLAIAVWPPNNKRPASGAKSGSRAKAASPQKNEKDPLVGIFIKFASVDQLQEFTQKQKDIEQVLHSLSTEKPDKTKAKTGKADPDFTFATLNDTFVMGNPVVVNRITRTKMPAKPLADEVDFKAARARLTDTPIFLYVVPSLLYKGLMDEDKKGKSSGTGSGIGASSGELAVLQNMFDLENLPKLGLGIQFQQTHTVMKGFVLDRNAALDKNPKSVFNMFKNVTTSLRNSQWISPQADIAVSFAMDWQGLYDIVIPIVEGFMAAKEGSGGSPIPMVEALIGYKIREQLLPALGNITVSLDSLTELITPPQGEQGKPPLAPKLNIMVELRNQEVIEGAIKNVTKLVGSGGDTSAEPIKEKGVLITKVGEGGYAIAENQLMFSPNLDALRHLIKERKAQRSLAAEQDFVRAMQGIPSEPTAWVYASSSAIKQVFDKLRREAVQEEPQLANVIAPYATPSQAVTAGAWKDGLDWVYEVRVPEGMLPILIASGIAANRAEKRDSTINEKANAAVSEFGSVFVSSKKGVVRLQGMVKSDMEKKRAQELVEKIEGVKSVVNDIEIIPEQ